jgi:hypothetical protein
MSKGGSVGPSPGIPLGGAVSREGAGVFPEVDLCWGGTFQALVGLKQFPFAFLIESV